jgi:threonine dehydratase
MSRLVPENKLAAIRALGAEARIIGASQDEAHEEAMRLVEQDGLAMVPPFDDLRVIAGQGTLGLEMVEDLPEVETVLIPLSGGGLLAGVAGAMKALRPGLRVVGISMERGAAMAASLEAGRPVPVDELPTLADSLGGGVGLDNRHSFAMVRELTDEVVLLSEAEIAEGIRHCYWQERQIVEGAAAVGVAALVARKVETRGATLALLSGGNIDMNLHARIVAGENPDMMREN